MRHCASHGTPGRSHREAYLQRIELSLPDLSSSKTHRKFLGADSMRRYVGSRVLFGVPERRIVHKGSWSSRGPMFGTRASGRAREPVQLLAQPLIRGRGFGLEIWMRRPRTSSEQVRLLFGVSFEVEKLKAR